jgi:hypothetical protein
MICKIVAVLTLFSFGVFAEAPKISETVKSFRTLSKTDDYVKALRSLGTPDSVIAEYSKPEFAGNVELMEKPGAAYPLFTKAHFTRAETFRENLDADPAKEYVSQVVFSTGAEKLDRKIYFVFIHDDDGSKLLGFKVFDELLCDHTPESPMTFGFVKKGASGPASIEFKIVRTISCGDDIDYYTEKDTLEFNGKIPVFHQGAPRDSVHIDRAKEMKEFNPLDD